MKKINVSNFLLAVIAFGGIMFSSCNRKEQVVKVQNSAAANFTASVTMIKPGGTVDFLPTGLGDVNAYVWNFPGADSSTSTLKEPKGIKYSKPGKYSVSLTYVGPAGSSTITKAQYIIVSGVELPITLDAKDSINLSTRSLYKSGTIADLDSKLKYKFRVVYSNSSNTPVEGYESSVIPRVSNDGKISFSIPLEDTITYYRLYTMIGEDEYYSATSTYKVPKATFSGITDAKTTNYFDASFKGNISDPTKLFTYGMCWVKDSRQPTHYDNSRTISLNSKGELDTNDMKFTAASEGTYTIRFFTKFNQATGGNPIYTYSNSKTVTITIPPVVFSNIVGPTLSGSNISFTGNISDPSGLFSYGICWVAGSGPATINSGSTNNSSIFRQSNGNFSQIINNLGTGLYSFRFYTFNSLNNEIKYIEPGYSINIPNLIGFESGGLPSNWSGTWTASTTYVLSGLYSATSQFPIGSGTSSIATFQINPNTNTNLTFSYLTDGDFVQGQDLFQIIIDNNTIPLNSGVTNWTNFSQFITAGPHTIQLRVYRGNTCCNNPQAYIDNLSF